MSQFPPLPDELHEARWNPGAFRDAAEAYYRQALSKAVNVGPEIQNLRMGDNHNRIYEESDFEFAVQRPTVC